MLILLHSRALESLPLPSNTALYCPETIFESVNTCSTVQELPLLFWVSNNFLDSCVICEVFFQMRNNLRMLSHSWAFLSNSAFVSQWCRHFRTALMSSTMSPGRLGWTLVFSHGRHLPTKGIFPLWAYGRNPSMVGSLLWCFLSIVTSLWWPSD